MYPSFLSKKSVKLSSLFLVIIILISFSPFITVNASSNVSSASVSDTDREKIFTEYKKMLLKDGDSTRFWIADMFDDGIDIPDLIVQNTKVNNFHYLTIFRYRDGKMEKIYDGDEVDDRINLTRMGFGTLLNEDRKGVGYTSGGGAGRYVSIGFMFINSQGRMEFDEIKTFDLSVNSDVGDEIRGSIDSSIAGNVSFKDGNLSDDTDWGPLSEVTVKGDVPTVKGSLPPELKKLKGESKKESGDTTTTKTKSDLNEEINVTTETANKTGDLKNTSPLIKSELKNDSGILVLDSAGNKLQGKPLSAGTKSDGNPIFDCIEAKYVYLPQYGLTFTVPDKWKGRALIMIDGEKVGILSKYNTEVYAPRKGYVVEVRGFTIKDKNFELHDDMPNSIILFTSDFIIENFRRSDYPAGEESTDSKYMEEYKMLIGDNTADFNKSLFSFDEPSKKVFMSMEASKGENTPTKGNTPEDKVKNAVIEAEKAYYEMTRVGNYESVKAPVIEYSKMMRIWSSEIHKHAKNGSIFEYVSTDDFDISFSSEDFGDVTYISEYRGKSTGNVYKSRMHLKFTIENGTVYFYSQEEEALN